MKKLLLLLSLLIVFCSEHTTEPPPEIYVDNVFEISEFPNTAGTEWIYAYYDSLTSSADTVLVSVSNDPKFEDGVIWRYIFKDRVDTQYVRVTADTLNIFTFRDSAWPSTIFVFPLMEGSSWDGKMYSHTSTVIGRDTIITKAGEFTNAWLVKEEWGAFNDYGYIDTWLVPNIGVVKKYHFGWSFGTANNTWEIIEYDPPEKLFN